MKRFFVVMLCLLFCCALRAPASAAKAGDFSYSLLEDGTAVITGYSGSEKELTIPAAVDGHPVSRIGADAFWGSPTLRRAVIPEGVTEIGSYAFAWCKKLDQVILPQSLAVLGDWAFWSSALRRVDIPDGVREISGTVFGNCENLRTVTVSAGHPALMLMDGAMLVRRSDMELIWYPTAKRPSSCVIPDGVRSIGDHVFYECASLKKVTFPDSVTRIGDSAFCGTGLSAVNLPPQLEEIGESAFACVLGLTELTLPSGLREVGDMAFADCDKLERILIPDSHPSLILLDGALVSVADLRLIWYPCGGAAGDYRVPDGIRVIGASAFRGCRGLTGLTVPGTVETIRSYAFSHCENLEHVRLDPGVTSIGYAAFEGCTAMTSLTVPEGVTSIGGSAFSDCVNLREIRLPFTLTKIGDNVFTRYNEAGELRPLDGLTVHVADGSFAAQYCASNGLNLQASADASPGSDFAWVLLEDGSAEITGYTGSDAAVVIPAVLDGHAVTRIGKDAFSSKTGLKRVVIPEGVTEIGDRAFAWCDSLQQVTLPQSLTSLGEWAFHCSGLLSVDIPDGVREIGEAVFSTASNLRTVRISEDHPALLLLDGKMLVRRSDMELIWYSRVGKPTSLVIPDGIRSIGMLVFEGCVSLTSVTLPDSLTRIGQLAFSCTGLRDITLPPRLEEIGNAAFEGCGSLKQIAIPDSVRLVEDRAFSSCDSLERVVVPDGHPTLMLTDGALISREDQRLIWYPGGAEGDWRVPDGIRIIGECAFAGCRGLTGLTIPDSVETIRDYAFSNCWSLARVDIGSGLKSIQYAAFLDCRALTSLTLPEGVERIGSYAFSECVNLREIRLPASVSSIGSGIFTRYDEDGELRLLDGLTVLAPDSSYAAQYCAENGVARRAGADAAPTEAPAETAPEAFEYTLLADGTAEITGFMDTETAVVIPASLDGHAVTRIGDAAFSWSSLESVVIPEGVTEIGYEAFFGCSALKRVTLPQTLTILKAWAFWGCGLERLDIPDSLTSVGDVAFGSCLSLREIRISDTHPTLMEGGEMLVRRNDRTLIWYSACGTSSSCFIPDGVRRIGDYAFFHCTGLTEVAFPDSVTEIGLFAFYMTGLRTVELPPKLTKIGSQAFGACPGLEQVSLPASVRRVEDAAFADCPVLDRVLLSDSHPSLMLADGALVSREDQRLIWYPGGAAGDFRIPEGIRVIGESAFSGCMGLTGVTIPGSVAEIGRSAFYSCLHLKTVAIRPGLTAIGERAFENCAALTGISLPEGLTTLGRHAFTDCVSLKEVLLPSSLREIGEDAFACYDDQGEPVVPAGLTVYAADGSYAAQYCAENGLTRKDSAEAAPAGASGERFGYRLLPDGTAEITAYTGTDTTVIIPARLDGYAVTKIGRDAFEFRRDLSRVVIPEGVTEIDLYAFDGCTGLKHVSLPQTLTRLGEGAFWGCALETVDLPDSLTEMGDQVFANCASLRRINISEEHPALTMIDGVMLVRRSDMSLIWYLTTGSPMSCVIPEGVRSIGPWVFYRCGTLTSVTFPDSLTSIGESAFCQTSLTAVEFPPQLESIDIEAFSHCPNLRQVTLPDSLRDLGDGAFAYCASLKSIAVSAGHPSLIVLDGALVRRGDMTLIWYPCGAEGEFCVPQGIRAIGECAFAECAGLTGVMIPGSVETIRDCAFNGCESLVYVLAEPGLAKVERAAFQRCESLFGLTLPEGVETVEDDAFAECVGLREIELPASLTRIGSGVFNRRGDGGERVPISGLTVLAPAGSPAAQYCAENGLAWKDSAGLRSADSFTYAVLEDGTLEITGWVGRGTDLAIPSALYGRTVSAVGGYALEDQRTLRSVTFPDSVRTIGDFAFSGCTALEDVTLPGGLLRLGRNAFYLCESLSSVGIPGSVETIGDYAFAGCTGLTGVTVGQGVRAIGAYAFCGCACQGFSVPDGVTSIGEGAFLGCGSLQRVSVPASVTAIGNWAFEDCPGVTVVVSNGSYAYEYCLSHGINFY